MPSALGRPLAQHPWRLRSARQPLSAWLRCAPARDPDRAESPAHDVSAVRARKPAAGLFVLNLRPAPTHAKAELCASASSSSACSHSPYVSSVPAAPATSTRIGSELCKHWSLSCEGMPVRCHGSVSAHATPHRSVGSAAAAPCPRRCGEGGRSVRRRWRLAVSFARPELTASAALLGARRLSAPPGSAR